MLYFSYPISSKVEFFAVQNFESKLFPDHNVPIRFFTSYTLKNIQDTDVYSCVSRVTIV